MAWLLQPTMMSIGDDGDGGGDTVINSDVWHTMSYQHVEIECLSDRRSLYTLALVDLPGSHNAEWL